MTLCVYITYISKRISSKLMQSAVAGSAPIVEAHASM